MRLHVMLFTNLEGLYKKATARKWSLTFNKVYVNEELVPKYTKFKSYK